MLVPVQWALPILSSLGNYERAPSLVHTLLQQQQCQNVPRNWLRTSTSSPLSAALHTPRPPVLSLLPALPPLNMAPTVKVPQPGPARLPKGASVDAWLEAAKECKYLSEFHMKQLCEIVKEYMMEGTLYRRLTSVAADLTPFLCRIKHPACLYPCHNMWRYPRPVLRPARALPCRRRHAKRIRTPNPRYPR